MNRWHNEGAEGLKMEEEETPGPRAHLNHFFHEKLKRPNNRIFNAKQLHDGYGAGAVCTIGAPWGDVWWIGVTEEERTSWLCRRRGCRKSGQGVVDLL